MSNSIEQQFGELNLSQEDNEQIFDQDDDSQDQRLVAIFS